MTTPSTLDAMLREAGISWQHLELMALDGCPPSYTAKLLPPGVDRPKFGTGPTPEAALSAALAAWRGRG